MRLKVEYAAQIKRAVGVGSEEIELNGRCTVATLLNAVADAHGAEIRELVLDAHGSPRKSLLLFVGDSQVHADAQVELRDGDIITIITPISGG